MFTRRGSEVSVVGRGLAGAAQACAETQNSLQLQGFRQKVDKKGNDCRLKKFAVRPREPRSLRRGGGARRSVIPGNKTLKSSQAYYRTVVTVQVTVAANHRSLL